MCKVLSQSMDHRKWNRKFHLLNPNFFFMVNYPCVSSSFALYILNSTVKPILFACLLDSLFVRSTIIFFSSFFVGSSAQLFKYVCIFCLLIWIHAWRTELRERYAWYVTTFIRPSYDQQHKFHNLVNIERELSFRPSLIVVISSQKMV